MTSDTTKKTTRPKGRRGPALTMSERAAAVIRIDNGESVDTIASEFHVSVQTVRTWFEQWRTRDGVWRDYYDELLPIEAAAGYELGDPDLTRGAMLDGRPMYRLPLRRRKPDPSAIAEVEKETEHWFLSLLGKMPPESLEQHVRAYMALDQKTRAALAPAWDVYQLSAYALEDARAKVRLAVEIAERELGVQVCVDTGAGDSPRARPSVQAHCRGEERVSVAAQLRSKRLGEGHHDVLVCGLEVDATLARPVLVAHVAGELVGSIPDEHGQQSAQEHPDLVRREVHHPIEIFSQDGGV